MPGKLTPAGGGTWGRFWRRRGLSLRCVRKRADRPLSHSNVFLSRFFNLTMFNIGYHLEHHDHPCVHWSELPELHQGMKKELIDGMAHVVAEDTSLTERLRLFMRGDSTVVDALLGEVLPKLHEIAARELKRERYMAPVSKTELIHEIWLSNLAKGGCLLSTPMACRSHRPVQC